MSEFFRENAPILFILFLIIIIMPLALIHINAIGVVAQTEQLREIVYSMGADPRSEDILGKVADTNMMIKSSRAYNEIPVLCLFVPNKLAELELIEIPKNWEEIMRGKDNAHMGR